MIIKSTATTYLLEPEKVRVFTGIETEKYVVIDKETSDFKIEHLNEFIVSEAWADEDLDGRKLRKIKKAVISAFGDILLDEYKTSNKIHQVLSTKFINTSGVSDVLKNALSNSMNVVLFGAGGFGKSEMCDKLFGCPELKDRVFIKSLSEATTEEDLFGGINIKKMTETGVIEYNCENSFANKEIVVFEEIFDANPRVLAALKDTLTSKEIRNGNQRFPIQTKIIIGLTNKTYEEVIQDDSTEALTQRFPISYKLQYHVTKLTAASLIVNRYPGYDTTKLAAIVESLYKLANVTPRKILELAKYLKTLEIKPNKNYSERITNNDIGEVISYLKSKRTIDCEQVLLSEIILAKKDVREEKITDYDSFVDLLQNIAVIKSQNIGAKVQSEADLTKILLAHVLGGGSPKDIPSATAGLTLDAMGGEEISDFMTNWFKTAA